ncbi:hypothetical protein BV898_10662 [Hypsibius exemplaris]|uniref:Uncharacterized protein n=1 Tax=Hypsibius exemplaris TaxID=2072580 RepID=A0A1W0WIV3_HYPEX|nr:hypothetical protein BV898_10662 [Hypsibius exemplaris]
MEASRRLLAIFLSNCLLWSSTFGATTVYYPKTTNGTPASTLTPAVTSISSTLHCSFTGTSEITNFCVDGRHVPVRNDNFFRCNQPISAATSTVTNSSNSDLTSYIVVNPDFSVVSFGEIFAVFDQTYDVIITAADNKLATVLVLTFHYGCVPPPS